MTESDLTEIRMRLVMRDQSPGGEKLFRERAAGDIAAMLEHCEQIGDWEAEYQEKVDEAEQEAADNDQKYRDTKSDLDDANTEIAELEKKVDALEEELERVRGVAAQ